MSKQSGFTLVEMMVSVAVIAIVSAFAFPSMQLMQSNARMNSAANDLATDLKQGRSGSLTMRTNFTVTAQVGGWSSGWQASHMVSPNASESSTPASRIALQKLKLPVGITIVQSVSPLVFNGVTGRVTDNTGNSVDVAFKICDSSISNETGFNVVMNRFGRILIQRHNDSSVCSV